MIPEPSDTPVDNKLQSGVKQGDRVQVVSKSSGQWVLASVVHVERSKAEVIVQHGHMVQALPDR